MQRHHSHQHQHQHPRDQRGRQHGSPRGPLTLDRLEQYGVLGNGKEAVRWSLFDSFQYAAAGQTIATLFQVPKGQGTNWTGTGVKNGSDTNMVIPGQLPTGQEFFVEQVEIEFWPATPTVAAAMPAAQGAQAAAVSINDQYIVRRAGALTLNVGSKSYIGEGPLGRFPAQTHFRLDSSLADSTTAGANQQARVAFARQEGEPFVLHPTPIYIPSGLNFNVSLTWEEGVQAISNPGRLFVRLYGLLIRANQ